MVSLSINVFVFIPLDYLELLMSNIKKIKMKMNNNSKRLNPVSPLSV